MSENKYIIDKDSLTGIADAVRDKLGPGEAITDDDAGYYEGEGLIAKFNLGNKPSKKSTSMKKIENDHNNNNDLSLKMPQQNIGVISLSQGKVEKKKKDKDKSIIKQANNTFYNFNLNVIQNNNNANSILNTNTLGTGYKGSNTSNNFATLLNLFHMDLISLNNNI